MRRINRYAALAFAALLSTGCQEALAAIMTDKAPPRSALLVRVAAPARPTVDQVIAALGDVPARDGIGEMEKRGFVRLKEPELRRLISGNTLKFMNSYSYYAKDSKVRLKEMLLGGGLESAGTWSITESNLCHSVREGHEFCSGIFFRDDQVLCWPGIGWSPDDTDYLRHCSRRPIELFPCRQHTSLPALAGRPTTPII